MVQLVGSDIRRARCLPSVFRSLGKPAIGRGALVAIGRPGFFFFGALFLERIVERLLHRLRRDYWHSLWTRSREWKGTGRQLLHSLWEQPFFRFNAMADGAWIGIVRPTPSLSRLSRLRASGQARLAE